MGHHTITDDGQRAQKRPLRVLLIEDSPLIRRSLVEAIDASGQLRVTAYADSPDDAIALLSSEAFDAVIVDLQLKRGSGVEVLAYLQKAGIVESAFAAVLTNHALPAYRERCRQYGVQHFFDKSLEFDRVIDALHNYARRRV
ncbi:Response regulator containing a CheY-like receiver domain and an HTH DNA-binding domain [Caballeronia glathei]|uniref:Chemotaxis protein CheY n=1 Tax=Caballeronia glathei TaxID=60547 RepID=A0A069PMG2_9BURK|nr:response regulator transcription factor [Caballeronia glathei]KDR41094.1 chemotaxis protein CheY [Caballeronia glathei]CDY77916.1 Response regulator containing a CheY-like receiver domain and an HTH DNA-binding domain [Caballeronia glathei]